MPHNSIGFTIYVLLLCHHNIQRERTTRALENALAEVIKAELAAQTETVKHQLRGSTTATRDHSNEYTTNATKALWA